MIQFDCSSIQPAVIKMLQVNMGLKPGEKVLFLGDAPQLADWRLDYEQVCDMALRSLMTRQAYDIACRHFTGNTIDLLFYNTTGMHGAEPPAEVAAAMLEHDVVIIINSFSLSHTRARGDACAQGVRIASCANLDLDMLLPNGVVDTDYYSIQKKAQHIADLLTSAQEVRLVTKQGTDLRFSIANRRGGYDDGFYSQPGAWGNLPGGEAYAAPVEGTAQGQVCVPRGWASQLDEDMLFIIADGDLQQIDGGGALGDQLRGFLLGADSPRHRRNLAELGIGTNPRAKKPDSVLEAEKIDGTIHIAFGDSSHLGGVTESDYHDDFVLPEPDLYLDGILVMRDGKMLV